jgi:hypothetical protein
VQDSTLQYSIVQHSAVQYRVTEEKHILFAERFDQRNHIDTIECKTEQSRAVQCSAVQYCGMFFTDSNSSIPHTSYFTIPHPTHLGILGVRGSKVSRQTRSE